MGVWTALLVALQLLLCLDVDAQVLGECQTCEVSNSDADDHFAVKGDGTKSFQL